MNTYSKHPTGSVLPLVAVSMVLLLLMLGIAVNLAWIHIAKSQVQTVADAAALAGAAELIDEDVLDGTPDQTDDIVACRDSAEAFASLNQAAGRFVYLDRNDFNDPDGGIVVGYIQDPTDQNSSFQTGSVPEYNSVRVEAGLTEELNSPLQLFLSAIVGVDSVSIRARSTATVDDRVVGFTLDEPERLDMLPFSVDEDYWNECLLDYYTTGSPISIFPNDPVTPGNFGTVDLGPPDNSTADLVYQIHNGLSASDLDAIDGLVLTDGDGDGIFTKLVQGDTGVGAVVGQAFDDIRGQTRMMPIHRNVVNPGNNATFELCGFIALEVFDAQMTGALHLRHIKVYPRVLRSSHAVINPSAPRSSLVYSALSLTR